MNKMSPFWQEQCLDISPVKLFPKFIIRFSASFNYKHMYMIDINQVKA